MPETLAWLLLCTLIPVAAIVVGGCAAVVRPHGRALASAFDHFAAGVVFSAVAVELLPKLHEVDRLVPMTLGFVAGVLVMMASKRWFAAAGALVPTAVDLFIDGLLIAIGLAAGKFGGMVLLAGLTVEALSLGLSSTPALVRRGASSLGAIATIGGLGLMILSGRGRRLCRDRSLAARAGRDSRLRRRGVALPGDRGAPGRGPRRRGHAAGHCDLLPRLPDPPRPGSFVSLAIRRARRRPEPRRFVTSPLTR